MSSTRKDTSQDNPQICHRTELGTHDGTEDRTRSRNVEELNHKDFPRWQDYVVNTVSHTYCRRGTVVGTKDLLDEATIDDVADNKRKKTDNKCNHYFPFLSKSMQNYK